MDVVRDLAVFDVKTLPGGFCAAQAEFVAGCREGLSVKRSRTSGFTRHQKLAHVPNHDGQLSVWRTFGYSFLKHFWRVVGRNF